MTNKELQEALAKFPPDRVIYAPDTLEGNPPWKILTESDIESMEGADVIYVGESPDD